MDSNMEGDSQTLETHRSSFKTRNFQNGVEEPNGGRNFDTAQGLEDEHCDSEAWKTLNKCFRKVQSVLDHNRVLIQLVNENHQSRAPDKLVKNVALIREINGNIGKVASLYSDLSVNFSNLIHKTTDSSKNDGVNDNELET